MWIVTIKLPRGWNGPHDPHNKVVGECPLSRNCTDSTGEHHSTIVDSESEVALLREDFHITRIERMPL